jgi:hypothetical protein
MGVKQLQSEESTQNQEQGKQHQYETLSTLFSKTDAFNEKGLTLLQQLQEAVWSALESNSTPGEVDIISRFL